MNYDKPITELNNRIPPRLVALENNKTSIPKAQCEVMQIPRKVTPCCHGNATSTGINFSQFRATLSMPAIPDREKLSPATSIATTAIDTRRMGYLRDAPLSGANVSIQIVWDM